MLSQDDQLNLADLPSDIIRKIIGTGVESIQRMKSISYRWNDLVLEHFQRTGLPIIRMFCWKMNKHGEHILRMNVSEDYKNYFGVENWNKDPSEPEIIEFRLSRPGFKSYYEKKKRMLGCINRYLSRCSRIESLELPFKHNRTAAYQFNNALNGVSIDKLCFSEISELDCDSKSGILDFIRGNHIRSLIFANYHASSIRGEEFFIVKALGLVSKRASKATFPPY